MSNRRILLTGATGYVGGRLLSRLRSDDVHLSCLTRRPDTLTDVAGPNVDVVQGDVFDRDSLTSAMNGIDVAYYLIHSMGSPGSFESQDRQAAENFAAAARAAKVKRIIYLGGLGHGPHLSPHLSSRQEVGRIFRASGVETIELRASIIIGSGSLSFEMIRSLTDRLPIMVTPRWVHKLAQPIAIEDVLAYLVQSAELPATGSRVYEVGGPDQVTYADIMSEYARQCGLTRLMIPVPVLTPRLSSLWLTLVTPLYASIGRELVDSIRNDTVVHDDAALRDFDVKPRGLKDAIARAIANEDRDFAQTRWSDALSAAGYRRDQVTLKYGHRLVDSRKIDVEVSPGQAFEPIRRLGGSNGWYCADLLWQVRGAFDLLMGGVGLRRGRRHPRNLRIGDAVDFWRVQAFEPGRQLLLHAEMKLPGRAWLQFEVEPTPRGARIRQTALFDPAGILGSLYWYALHPIHRMIFAGMLRGIARRADRGYNGGSDHRPVRAHATEPVS